jgi:hypothetical protein
VVEGWGGVKEHAKMLAIDDKTKGAKRRPDNQSRGWSQSTQNEGKKGYDKK